MLNPADLVGVVDNRVDCYNCKTQTQSIGVASNTHSHTEVIHRCFECGLMFGVISQAKRI